MSDGKKFESLLLSLHLKTFLASTSQIVDEEFIPRNEYETLASENQTLCDRLAELTEELDDAKRQAEEGRRGEYNYRVLFYDAVDKLNRILTPAPHEAALTSHSRTIPRVNKALGERGETPLLLT